jgi:alpha-beta hydrolase superfamily lysophospholipase
MKENHFTFTADDGARLYVYRWLPDVGLGRAVVHIAHGLAEHAGRYERLAETLTDNGYVVIANDHRGHGRTAGTPEQAGHFADSDGWRRVLSDIEQLRARTQQDYPQLLGVLFGHSMGSLIAQHLLYRAPRLFDAVVMSGANGLVSPLVHTGKLIARFERWRLGKSGKSELINGLTFDAFNKAFAPNRTAFDWLSRDEAEVDKYIADPWCGFLCSTQLWIDMLGAITEAARKDNRARIPHDIPIYLFSGSRDPVNAEGRGTTALAESYRASGMKSVSYRVFPQARHETLNEINRAEVTEYLLDWLNAILKLRHQH